MAYRKPGTYARFVRTVSPAVDAGGSRILGLVGTGINYYTIQNEAIIKATNRPYDTLAHDNVFEILSVSSKPIYDDVITTENIVYQESSGDGKQKGYNVNGNVITWDTLFDAERSFNYKAPNSEDFYKGAGDGTNLNITAEVVESEKVIDGKWTIEVSYINEDDIDNDPKLGCYRIIDSDTAEIIGEYVVSDDPVTNEDGSYPIPGIALIVRNTFIIKYEDYVRGAKPKVGVGDYVTLTTTAAKTEREALAYAKAMDVNKGTYNLEFSKFDFIISEDDKKEGLEATWNEIIGSTGRYSLWVKTSEFEGYSQNEKDQKFIEPSADVNKYTIDSVTYKSFSEEDLKDISGQTLLLGNIFTFKFTYIAENSDTRTKEAIKIEIGNYNNKFKYYCTDFNGTTTPLTRKTTTLPVNSATKEQAGNNSYIIDFGVYSFEKSETEGNETVTKKYNWYDTIGTSIDENSKIVTGIVHNYDTSGLTGPDLCIADGSVFTEKTYYVGADAKNHEEDFHSTVYNEDTQFYGLIAALDENQNAIDFAYASTASTPSGIFSEGPVGLGASFRFVDNAELNAIATITASGVHATRPDPGDDPGRTNGNLLNAITDVKVISNDTIYQTPAVYRLTLFVDDTDNKYYFRAVRFVDGQEDTSYIRYNGNYSDEALSKYYKAETGDDTITISDVAENFPDKTTGYIKEEGSNTRKPVDIEINKAFLIEVSEEIFDYIDGTNILVDVDYLITCEKGAEVLIITSPRVTETDVPAEGDTYYVSYKYRKADVDYDPIFFDNYDDIVTTYGNYDVSASSAVMNSLSLGAEIAFNNGVSQIVCCQARNNSDYEMQSAIDRMAKEIAGATNIQTIIPLSTSDAVAVYLQKHVTLMSSYEYGKERMGYVGAKIDQAINKIATRDDRTLGMRSIAEGFDDERIVYVPCNGIIRQIRDLRTGRYNERVLPGVYAAVAVASVGLSQDPAEPLTNKNIAGFVRLKNLFTENEKNQLADSGCCVLEHNGQNIRIRHGITTNNNEVNSQEITLIQIKDYVIDACRRLTRDTYIGRKLTQTIISDISYTIETMLENFISQAIIINYSSLKVVRDKNEPRQVNVSFEIEAVYPLNWINIEFGFSAVQ